MLLVLHGGESWMLCIVTSLCDHMGVNLTDVEKKSCISQNSNDINLEFVQKCNSINTLDYNVALFLQGQLVLWTFPFIF